MWIQVCQNLDFEDSQRHRRKCHSRYYYPNFLLRDRILREHQIPESRVKKCQRETIQY